MIHVAATIRSRMIMLLLVAGLVLPTMHVKGEVCGVGSSTGSCALVDDAPEDSCCSKDTQEQPAPAEDDDCCPDGCKCLCCRTAVVPVMHNAMPVRVTIGPPTFAFAVPIPALAPQKSGTDLFHPPKS